MNLTRKSIPNSRGIKSKIITKLFDILMNRGLELWNDKGIITTLTEPSTLGTAVGRGLWSKILVNQCAETCKQGWLF